MQKPLTIQVDKKFPFSTEAGSSLTHSEELASASSHEPISSSTCVHTIFPCGPSELAEFH
jgi:hypothetical protein